MKIEAPMYVITPKGAEVLSALGILRNGGLITAAEYRANVRRIRVTHKVTYEGRNCSACWATASWRYIDTYGEPAWGYLCCSCAARETAAMMRTHSTSPWILEPIANGVYAPEIGNAMLEELATA